MSIAATERASTTASAIRVLLVDDHRSFLWGLERLIETEQPRMIVAGKATSVEEALALIAAAQPDVVLLDLDLGGTSSVGSIPQLVERSQAKVLVLTGAREPELHQAALLAGARGVISKEALATDILKAIAKVHAGELWADHVTTQRVISALAKPRGKEQRQQDRLLELAAREREIVAKLRSRPDASMAATANSLGIGEHTLRNHLSSIYDKLGVAGRLQLYVFLSKH